MERSFLKFLPVFSLFFWASLPPSHASDKLPFQAPRTTAELPAGAEIVTSRGTIVIELLGDLAPLTVRNFEHLAKKNFYNNLTFHNVEPGYVVQGGDPKGTGKGGPGYTLPPEFSEYDQRIGTVGMLRLPSQVNPERRSNGSQFYILLRDSPHLNGMYTVFGRVLRGLEVAQQIRKGDKILGVKLRPR